MKDYSDLEKRLVLFCEGLKKYNALCLKILNHPDSSKRDPSLLIEEERQRESLMRDYGELSADIHGMAGWDSFDMAGKKLNAFISALDHRLDKDNFVKWNGIEIALSCLNKAIGSCRNAKSKPAIVESKDLYINLSRIEEIRAIKTEEFDLRKLIRILEEINICSINGCLYGTIYLIRALLDHVPPIFKCHSFQQVGSSYGGGRSFKKIMAKLEDSLREIANIHLHATISKTEAMPNETQVDFKQEIDTLIAEIIKLLSRGQSNR